MLRNASGRRARCEANFLHIMLHDAAPTGEYLMPKLLYLCLLFATVCSAIRAEEKHQLRVLCYNIHYGQGTDGRYDIARLAKVIHDCCNLHDVTQHESYTATATLTRMTSPDHPMGFVGVKPRYFGEPPLLAPRTRKIGRAHV